MSKLFSELTNLYDQDLANIDADAPNEKVINFLFRNKIMIEELEKAYMTSIEEAAKKAQKIGYADGSLAMINDFEKGISTMFAATKNELTSHFNKLKETLVKIKNQK